MSLVRFLAVAVYWAPTRVGNCTLQTSAKDVRGIAHRRPVALAEGARLSLQRQSPLKAGLQGPPCLAAHALLQPQR
eukprot:869576-Rhodomonas_salina.1